jgi:hypothetical protein
MRRGALALLAGLALLTAARPAAACGYGLPSPVAMLIRSDVALVGKVTAVEEKPVTAFAHPRTDVTVDYKIAVLEVVRALKGGDGATHVKVGLLPHQTVAVGQVSCFFLIEHNSAPFFVYSDRYDYPQAAARADDTEMKRLVERLARYGRLLERPDDGLKSRDAEERYLTAVLLLTQHNVAARSGRRGAQPMPPVNFSDDRLARLMVAVTEGDWGKPFEDFDMSPWSVMGVLRAGPADGWVPDGKADAKQLEAQTKKWLREHAGAFRMKAG